jgi:hypothetical protein
MYATRTGQTEPSFTTDFGNGATFNVQNQDALMVRAVPTARFAQMIHQTKTTRLRPLVKWHRDKHPRPWLTSRRTTPTTGRFQGRSS